MALFGKKIKDATVTDTVTNATKTTKKISKKLVKKSDAPVVAPYLANILLAPIVTEKAYALSESRKYVFRVTPGATKRSVAQAVGQIYGVSVQKVNMMIKKQQNTKFRGISGTTRSQKKAIVTIAKGESIDLFE